MFKNVGKELKIMAEAFVVSRMLLAGLVSFVLIGAGVVTYEGVGFLVATIISVFLLVIVYNIARHKAIELYAYGELVDRVMRIEKAMNGAKSKQETEPASVYGPVPTPTPQGVQVASPEQKSISSNWFCTNCGTENVNWAQFCKKCGTKK